jgi:hypothetical protein
MADKEQGAVRYDTWIATLIGALAIAVSAYTAYVQRQQVCAQVWPVLELSTSNEPELIVSVSNKGVGPALVRHVIITVDDKPVPNWKAALLHFGRLLDVVQQAVPRRASPRRDARLPFALRGNFRAMTG